MRAMRVSRVMRQQLQQLARDVFLVGGAAYQAVIRLIDAVVFVLAMGGGLGLAVLCRPLRSSDHRFHHRNKSVLLDEADKFRVAFVVHGIGHAGVP